MAASVSSRRILRLPAARPDPLPIREAGASAQLRRPQQHTLRPEPDAGAHARRSLLANSAVGLVDSRGQGARHFRLAAARTNRKGATAGDAPGAVDIHGRRADTAAARRARQLLHERVRQLRVGSVPRRDGGVVEQDQGGKEAPGGKQRLHGCRRRRLRVQLDAQYWRV